jgi:hypothetical protein
MLSKQGTHLILISTLQIGGTHNTTHRKEEISSSWYSANKAEKIQQASSSCKSATARPRLDTRLTQNVLLIWLDSSINDKNLGKKANHAIFYDLRGFQDPLFSIALLSLEQIL